jgi:hypothetical protein
LCGEDFSGHSSSYDEAPDDLVTGCCYEGLHSSDIGKRLGMDWERDEELEYECEECAKMLRKTDAYDGDEKNGEGEVIDLS